MWSSASQFPSAYCPDLLPHSFPTSSTRAHTAVAELACLDLEGLRTATEEMHAILQHTTLTRLQLRDSVWLGSPVQLPDQLSQLEQLQILELGTFAAQDRWGLQTVTPLGGWQPLGSLQRLTSLSLQHCDLTELPATLSSLRGLRTLNASSYGKNMGGWDALEGLQQLTSLTASGVLMYRLPQVISSLTTLHRLDISSNTWASYSGSSAADDDDVRINASMQHLSGLPLLTYLNLSNCHLRKLPAAVIALTGLRELDLSDVNYRQVSHVRNRLRGKCTARMSFSSPCVLYAMASLHRLSTLTGLTSLDLSNCCITKIPDAFRCLTGLLELNLRDNPVQRGFPTLALLTNLQSLTLPDLTHLPAVLRALPPTCIITPPQAGFQQDNSSGEEASDSSGDEASDSSGGDTSDSSD